MTKLGEYLQARSVNKSEISRKTGLSKARIGELTINKTTRLRVEELYVIALAIDADPCDILKFVCQGLKIKK